MTSSDNKLSELKELLVTWRSAEKEHASASLSSAHPDHLRELHEAEKLALHKLRVFVDSEPWPELL